MKILYKSIILLTVVGCSSTQVARLIPATRELISTSHLLEKNYVLNKENFTPVGGAIVKSYDYYLNKYVLPEVVSNKDSQITSFVEFSTRTVNLSKGQVIKINGKSNFRGREVYVLDMPIFRQGVELLLVADPSGKILPNLVYNTYVGGFVEWPLKNTESTDTSFRSIETTSQSEKGSVNFELIYTGLQNENITILYREYTADNLARPAYYQNLFFPTKDKVVRFNKIKVEVVSATSEFLKYVVRED